MRWGVGFLSFLILGAAGSGGGGAPQAPSSAVSRIVSAPDTPEELVRDWIAMWNSSDLNEVDRLFLADERVSYFSSERNEFIQGIAEVRKHHQSFSFAPGGNSRGTRLWIEKMRIQPFGDTVVVGGIWIFQRPGVSEEQAQRGPVTLVGVKAKDGWRIAHAHFSNNR